MPRILLTTRSRESGLYDYYRENAPRDCRWRFGMPRRFSFGLRFLRQNVPGVSIRGPSSIPSTSSRTTPTALPAFSKLSSSAAFNTATVHNESAAL
jgi:hypothetical protein